MPSKLTRAVIGSTLLTALFAGVLLGTVPKTWEEATSWAQEMTGSDKRRLVLPKVVQDYMAQHQGADAASEPAQAPDDLLSVSKQQAEEQDDFGGSSTVMKSYLVVTSKVDSIVINKIVGNRGNCEIGLDLGTALLKGLMKQAEKDEARKRGEAPPAETQAEPVATLKFGETIKLRARCQNLIEAEIDTDQGPMIFSWDNRLKASRLVFG